MPGWTTPGEPLAKFLGKPANEDMEIVKKANPITYVGSEDPPTLMIHGEKDDLVTIQQSEMLCAVLTKAGVRARVVRVTNAGHGFSPSTQGAAISPSKEEIQRFKDVFEIK